MVSASRSDRAEPGAGTAGGGIAVLHATFGVGHATAAIERQQFQSRTVRVVEPVGVDVAAVAMLEQVGGEFGDDDRHLVDARLRQPGAPCNIAHQSASFGDLTGIGDGGEHAKSNAPE